MSDDSEGGQEGGGTYDSTVLQYNGIDSVGADELTPSQSHEELLAEVTKSIGKEHYF